MTPDTDTPAISAVIDLIDRLRGENGCPWDRKQTPASLSVYLVEEVFELVEAIESGDPAAVCEELGDVLFQVLFIACLFRETGHFTIEEAARRITAKMIRRHPHVFGDETAATTEEVRSRWHEIKKAENRHRRDPSILDSIPAKLPALMRAYRVSERAARTGFDWDDLRGVLDKAGEEWAELNAELDAQGREGGSEGRAALEFGDVLFTLVNVARLAGFHPERALNRSISKFQRRFQHMERQAARRGEDLETIGREEMERLWEIAKSETPP